MDSFGIPRSESRTSTMEILPFRRAGSNGVDSNRPHIPRCQGEGLVYHLRKCADEERREDVEGGRRRGAHKLI
jgi:hypothetical protein